MSPNQARVHEPARGNATVTNSMPSLSSAMWASAGS